jgi:hypothetical protein
VARSIVKYTKELERKSLEALAYVKRGIPIEWSGHERTISESSSDTENVSHGTAACREWTSPR